MATDIRVSVIVATIEHWPAVKPCLDRVLPQAIAADGELILADGTPGGTGAPPPDIAAYSNVRVIRAPNQSIFSLRAKAAEVSCGPFLIFTEDHCVPSETWIAQLLQAHAANPDADMVAGAITNGSSDGLVDWANFLMTFAEFMPPAPQRPLIRTPPIANASFRRRVIFGGPLPEGWLEIVLGPTLMHEGRLHYDDRILVSHVQPRGIRMACAAHFNNGRACAGLVLPHIARRDWVARLWRTPILPAYLFASVYRSVAGRAIPFRARLGLTVVPTLCAAHAIGEFIGLIWGEGHSARRLN